MTFVRAFAAATAIGVASLALAADIPLLGRKLSIREAPGREPRIELTCPDPTVVVPAPFSAGDPSIHGLVLEIYVADGGVRPAQFVPNGDGWTVTPSPLRYRYRNKDAPDGGSVVRKLELRPGKQVKLSTRGAPVFAASPAGSVLVRLRLASGDVYCARFDQDELVKDVPGRLVGRNADRPASCDPPTTSTVTTTTSASTTSTSLYPPCAPPGGPPTCGGTCDAGSSCSPVSSLSHPETNGVTCVCLPDGLTPCGAGAYPTCDGACDAGNACLPFRVLPNGTEFCACANPNLQCGDVAGPGTCQPGVCPPGQVCQATAATNLCSCGPF